MTENPYCLNIEQIKGYLPHRPPFLLVDRVLEIHPSGDIRDLSHREKVGTRVVALKNVSFNEPHFQGHFPEYAIMPGVLVIEAMAQTACFSIYPQMQMAVDKPKQVQCLLVGVDNVRFRRPTVPGDQLRIESLVTKARGRVWAFHCEVSVDGNKIAEADILANWLTGLTTVQND